VLEAKLVLHPKILISIQTEFVDNEAGKEMTKQDCERKACWRLMEKLKKAFPRLPICLCGGSLYACEGFFERCRRKNWRYILRYKEGSIPSIAEEYRKLKRLEKNYQEQIWESKDKFKRQCCNQLDTLEKKQFFEYNGIVAGARM
jgi:hypothetical protein